MEQEIIIQTPGKLMMAGEFAVLEQGQHAMVTAVNRYVYASLTDARENQVSLPDFDLHQLAWKQEVGQVSFSTADERLDFIANALNVVYTYLKEKQVPVTAIHLTLRSELADESGIKYGLGSSAAVVTAAVEAILTKFLGRISDRDLVFKLAAMAHVTTQGSGSGADIAASVYGGVLNYVSFQAEWLLEAMEKADSIVSLVEEEWAHLAVQSLPTPDFVQFLTAWTGTAASTKDLVARMRKMKVSNPEAYEFFLQESAQAVQDISKGLKQKDNRLLFSGITKNRHALKVIGEITNIPVETEKLAALSMCAEQLKGAGKLSGAGGGDCGIAFIPLESSASELQSNWRKKDIKPLDLKMHEHSMTE